MVYFFIEYFLYFQIVVVNMFSWVFIEIRPFPRSCSYFRVIRTNKIPSDCQRMSMVLFIVCLGVKTRQRVIV